MANQIKDAWMGGRTVFGGWCTIGSPFAAELIALARPDYIVIDAQHGLFGFETLVNSLMAVARTEVAPIVRVASGDAGQVGRVLDAGAHGVIIPMIETAEDAEAAVRACRYAPLGERSFGPVRASQVFGRDPNQINRDVLCIAMIETALAVENIDEILDVPGMDAIYVGPADLAISYGLQPGLDAQLGVHAEAHEHVLAVASRKSIPVGIPCANAEVAQLRAEEGYRMISVGADVQWIGNTAIAEFGKLKS